MNDVDSLALINLCCSERPPSGLQVFGVICEAACGAHHSIQDGCDAWVETSTG